MKGSSRNPPVLLNCWALGHVGVDLAVPCAAGATSMAMAGMIFKAEQWILCFCGRFGLEDGSFSAWGDWNDFGGQGVCRMDHGIFGCDW